MHTLQHQPATESIRATVFDIPFLIDLIACHLTNRDIYRCTLASQQFHDAFQHCLYTSISIEHRSTLEKFTCKEAVRAFSSHLSYVREVFTSLGECIMHLVNEDNFQCAPPQALRSASVLLKNLVDFRYRAPLVYGMDLEACSTSILLLLKASPALQVLHLSGFAGHSETLVLGLAKAIREKGRQLKEFRLLNPIMRIQGPHLFTLLWSCAAVEVLLIGFGILPGTPTTPSADTFSSLRTLAREALCSKRTGSRQAKSEATILAESLQNTDKIEFTWKALGGGSWLVDPTLEMILELLQMCPSLERMIVPKLNERDVITYMAPLVAKALPQLRHLNLNLIHDQPLGTCRLVQSCKNLISLKMERLQFDSRLLVDSVVLRHGHSLQTLHIERSDKLSSQQLNLILSNCPRLLSLYALVLEYRTFYLSPILNSEHMAMVPDKPGWSCKNLETLQLCYGSEDTSIGIPEVLWRQIGQLSKLKDLRLFRRSWYGTGVQEQGSVMQAVDSWKALTDLRRLELRNLNAFLDEKLVNQAKDQWSKLEWVQYTYN